MPPWGTVSAGSGRKGVTMRKILNGTCDWCGRWTKARLVEYAATPISKRSFLRCPIKCLPLYRCGECGTLQDEGQIKGAPVIGIEEGAELAHSWE